MILKKEQYAEFSLNDLAKRAVGTNLSKKGETKIHFWDFFFLICPNFCSVLRFSGLRACITQSSLLVPGPVCNRYYPSGRSISSQLFLYHYLVFPCLTTFLRAHYLSLPVISFFIPFSPPVLRIHSLPITPLPPLLPNHNHTPLLSAHSQIHLPAVYRCR